MTHSRCCFHHSLAHTRDGPRSQVGGKTLHKTFVEKPVSGEDHNINIYYPSSMGGGMKSLFRKKGDRSAEFHADVNHVRTDGSYMYENFLPTGGTDVKVRPPPSSNLSHRHQKGRTQPV